MRNNYYLDATHTLNEFGVVDFRRRRSTRWRRTKYFGAGVNGMQGSARIIFSQ